jgi:hypothetical protein
MRDSPHSPGIRNLAELLLHRQTFGFMRQLAGFDLYVSALNR